jgi:hypothetical protein
MSPTADAARVILIAHAVRCSHLRALRIGASRPVAVFCSGFDWLHADKEGHLEPLPVAVDVIEAELAQPPELGLDGEQAIRGIFILEWFANRGKEGQVEAVGRRGYMLEVSEDSAGLEEIEDLTIERVFSLVLEVVDGKRGDDNVKAPERGPRLREVVPQERDTPVVEEPLARRPEHGLGKVEAHTVYPGAIAQEGAEQPPIARPEVEDAPGVARHLLEQDTLSLCAVRIGVSPGEVAQRVFRVLPFLGGHARILAGWNPVYCLRWNTLVALFHSCAERSGGVLTLDRRGFDTVAGEVKISPRPKRGRTPEARFPVLSVNSYLTTGRTR